MTDIVLLAKLALGVTSAVAGVVLCHWRAPFALSDEHFGRLAMATLVASRLTIWAILYVVLGLDVQSDVPVAYLPQALEALAGGVVYADIDSSYGPLFPYLVAVPVGLWSSAKAIVLFTIGVECAAVAVWMRVGRLVTSEQTVRAAALLYLVNPVAILMNPVAGSNQAWVMLAAGAASWFLLRGREVASGLALAAGVVGVKLLAGLFAPALWVGVRRHQAWLAALIVPVAAAYSVLALSGVDVIAPLRYESSLVTSGNLPFLIRAVGLPADGSAMLLVMAVWITFVTLDAWRSEAVRQPGSFVFLVVNLLLFFMLLSPKSHTNYLAMFLFPICLTLASRGITTARVAWFGAFMTVAAVEPSLHFRWFEGLDLRAAPHAADPVRVAVFLAVELALVAGYVWLARAGWREASRRPVQ